MPRERAARPPGRVERNRLDYEARVNRVVDHVYEHLSDELALGTLARVAGFSPFHFHRVFKGITGERLFEFIQRVRIERAAIALASHADARVLEIALDHGFASAAGFARAFRTHFGMSAMAWRSGGAAGWRARHLPESNPGKHVRKRGKATARSRRDTPRYDGEDAMQVRVKDLPPHHVAYMRWAGPFGAQGIPGTWAKLRRWMESRGVPGEVTLGLSHDDPSITAPEKCRYDACVVVPAHFAPDRWVNVTDVPGGRYAVWEFVGTAHEIVRAWQRVFASWLPGSGWEPDDRPCYELHRNNPTVDAKPAHFRCDLCLPVRPLS